MSMNKNNYAVIMAGGIGSRFWPISTEDCPKQFLDILNTGETLIQKTFKRLQKICINENIFIVTNKKYIDLCKNQLPDLNSKNILCEPMMRNTAPCIAYATFKIENLNKDANILVAASDHLIEDEDEFIKIVNDSFEITKSNDVLLTLGIKPLWPDTGYGYIQYTDEKLNSYQNVNKVKTFTEKPNQDLALSFIDSGDFLWNSGMFVWSAKSINIAFRKYLRDIYDIFEEGKQFYNTNDESKYIERVFGLCKNISIDYAIMEKANNVYVYPASFGWTDLGTWGSLYKKLSLDKNDNTITGKNVITYDCNNNIVKMPNEKVVVLQGLEGYIIVEKDDVLLVCKKEEEQQIKKFVSDLSKFKNSN